MLRVLTGPGDVVAFSPPIYPPFFDWVVEAGAQTREIPLAGGWRAAGGWTSWPWNAPSPTIRRSTSCATRTTRWGGCTTPEELAALVRLARIYQVTHRSAMGIACPHWSCPVRRTHRCSACRVRPTSRSAVHVAEQGLEPRGSEMRRGHRHHTPGWAGRSSTGLLPAPRWRTGHLGVPGLRRCVTQTARPGWTSCWAPSTVDGRLLGRAPSATDCPRSPVVPAGGDLPGLAGLLGDRRRRPGPRDPDSWTAGGWRSSLAWRFGAAGAGYVRLNFGTSAEILDQATTRMAAALR